MISNYFKLAIRVLGRNKFFTAISLFGISFTLAILMLIVSVLETEVGVTQPLSDKDKMVLLPNLNMTRQFYDTIWSFDSLLINEVLTIDSTYKLEESGQNNSNNQFAYWFLEKHVDEVPNAVNRTFFNAGNSFNAYVNNSKVELNVTYVDHNFWDILDWDFTEGFGFGEESVTQAEPVAVITTELADQYFGRTSNVLDERLEMDGKTYRVMGVVKPAGISLLATNILVPYPLIPNFDNIDDSGFGGFMGLFLAESPAQVRLVKQDIEFINAKTEVPPSMQDNYDNIEFPSYSYYEIYADRILDLEEPEDSLSAMRWVLIGILSLFILLPTLNLINLNVSRIMERSSEIGVRKAFGAHQSVILMQFIIENIVQTLLGGIIGLALALLGMYIINDVKLLGDTVLKINYRFFLFSFLICILFGVISGLLPAYRMSKLHVVNALKSK